MGNIMVHADRGLGVFVEPVDGPEEEGLYMHGHDITALVGHIAGSPCGCGESDGTVDCACGTSIEFYEDAQAWLDENAPLVVEDPGYFDHLLE